MTKPRSLLAGCLAVGLSFTPAKAQGSDYLEAAKQAAQWIESTARLENGHRVWPVHIDEPEIQPNLYSGVAGPVLFLLELSAASGDQQYLAAARRGADYLRATLDDPNQDLDAGLYSGLAGIGFALEETYRATQETAYREAVQKVLARLSASAKNVRDGIEWSDSTDIISGTAGIGLFLLYEARETGQTELKKMAISAGERLLDLARPVDNGLYWAMTPDFPRIMPNFSHGTAGISYFLARLADETGETRFLDAALKGANHLLSIANTDGDVCLIYHHRPAGEDLYYLGWCHGPVGTARTFYQLWKQTGDPKWRDAMDAAARGILNSGIPEKEIPGFWNNVSQCCGSAGVVEFFLALYALDNNPEYLRFAEKMTANLLSRSSEGQPGLKWVQAEHRVRPELLIAQTGYMQGAAGIGMLLIHFEKRGQPGFRKIPFPDSPF